MAELSDQIESLGKHVQADFSKRRAMAVFSRLGPMQHKRKRRRLVATVGSLVAIAVLVLWNVRTTGPSRELSLTHTRLAQVVTEKMVRLADGSLARVLDDQSRLTLFSEQPDKVVVKLRGAASFQISKNPGRLYRLETERVAIEVLGTRFSVREQTDGRVFVEVTEGRVRVSFDGQKKELSAGERGTFPLSVLSSPQTAADTVSQNKAGAVLAPDSTDRVAAPVSETGNVFSEPPKDASKPLPSVVPWLAHRRESGLRPAKATALSAKKKAIAWQSLAEQGHFEQAFSEIASRGGMSAFLRQEQLDAAELLLLGDVARYAQHAEDAVPPLKNSCAMREPIRVLRWPGLRWAGFCSMTWVSLERPLWRFATLPNLSRMGRLLRTRWRAKWKPGLALANKASLARARPSMFAAIRRAADCARCVVTETWIETWCAPRSAARRFLFLRGPCKPERS